MAQIVVRQLNEDVRTKLQIRVGRHGLCAEEEVCQTTHAVQQVSSRPLSSRLADRFAKMGLEQEIPELRGYPARPAELGP